MKPQETTRQLEELLERHAPSVERAIERCGLPLHLAFHEVIEENAGGFLETAARLYPETTVAFAVKSNPCRGAVRTAAGLGLGADVASEFELQAALQEGIDPHRIICNGNAKSDTYLDDALAAGAILAVDNATELDGIQSLARRTGTRPQILTRFRGMPLSGLTSEDQTTAADWTKFGFHVHEAPELFARLRATESLDFVGISAHIGTQIADPAGYERLVGCFFRLVRVAMAHGLTVRALDVGGGYPVRFLAEEDWRRFTGLLLERVRHPDAPASEAVTWNDLPMGYAHVRQASHTPPDWIGKAYWTAAPAGEMLAHLLGFRHPDGRTTAEHLRSLGSPRLIVEPGRSLMASAGVTLTRAMDVKTVLGHAVVALDLGINNHGTNLITPDIFPAAVLPRSADDEAVEAFLAGRLCFSGDMISKAKVSLNRLPRRGERFVVFHTGAYGADHFASHSCGFPRPAKVAIGEDGTIELWRAREGFGDVFGEPGEPLLLDGQ